jgi:hypothetical protein
MEFDADHDGKLDKAELMKFAEAMAPGRHAPAKPAEPAASAPGPGVTQAPLVFSGGYETDPRDRGRPVILVASALGVSSDVFREAFSRVRPAGPGTEPEPEQVRRNKSALMAALGKYGISNERLDEVSNYYRYPPGRGNRWRTTPASGYAQIKNGKVTSFVITNGGSGYSSTPSVSVQGMPEVAAQAKLSYGKDFATNGAISEISLAPLSGN